MNNEFNLRLNKIEEILKAYLPQTTNSDWQNLTFGDLDSCINDSHISMLSNPCNHIISLGGKRWRPLLLVLTAEMTSQSKKNNVNIDNAYNLTPLVEFAHTASLIHDDIEDCADTRRGEPCIHITYGTDVAINAATWLYFQGTTCIEKLNITAEEKIQLYKLFLTELRLLHLGQAMDIKWHRNPSLIPSTEEYMAMVRNKTGTLARLAVKLGILAGGGTNQESLEAGLIAQDIGVGFQIIDDVINLTSGNPGKKRGDDIVEGKKSLPVLLHLKKNPNDISILSDLFNQAKNEGIESSAVEKAIDLLTNSGSIEDARLLGNQLIASKTKELINIFNTKTEAQILIENLFNKLQK